MITRSIHRTTTGHVCFHIMVSCLFFFWSFFCSQQFPHLEVGIIIAFHRLVVCRRMRMEAMVFNLIMIRTKIL